MINLDQFPSSRYRHCYGVGKKMYWYSKIMLGWDEKKCREMFVLGNLHDIGYEFNGDSFQHNIVLSEILKDKYPYWKEILYHPAFQTEYDSMEMKLLYYADLTVDGYGNWVTMEERMNDLIKRHGEDSGDVKEGLKIINALKGWGFVDVEELNQYANCSICYDADK
jgi:hypothetical protein